MQKGSVKKKMTKIKRKLSMQTLSKNRICTGKETKTGLPLCIKIKFLI